MAFSNTEGQFIDSQMTASAWSQARTLNFNIKRAMAAVSGQGRLIHQGRSTDLTHTYTEILGLTALYSSAN